MTYSGPQEGVSVLNRRRRRGVGMSHRSRRGFTLIEVMVAIVLLSVGILGVMGAVRGVTRASGRAEETVEAVTLARGMLNEIKSSGSVQTGTSNGDFGVQNPGYRWESTVETSADVADLLQITVTVLWPDGPRENRYNLTTLYLPPPTASTTDSTSATTTGGAAGGSP